MAENRTTTTALSDKQLRALPYLVAGPTVSEPGLHKSGFGRYTDGWRMKTSELSWSGSAEAAELAYTELKGLMLKAVHVLGSAMEDPNPQIRLRAAQTALTVGLKATELKDIQKRLDLLDAALPLWTRRNTKW